MSLIQDDFIKVAYKGNPAQNPKKLEFNEVPLKIFTF
jgi:hypothetical protein